MIDAAVLPAFVLAAAVLVAIPGPAILYIVSTGIGRGRGAALASMAGIEVGALFHVFAATVGVSAIVASSTVAFLILKYAGAAYLIYLGWKTLRSKESPVLAHLTGETSNASAFGRGIVVNILNPKVALFFLAFLPQFVDPGRGRVTGQFLVLGFVFIGVAIVIDSIYALASGAIGGLLNRSPRWARGQKRVAGFTYLALGASAALTGNNSK
ncbi:MAG: LysE family translocator [Acidimicrobiia bacterium]